MAAEAPWPLKFEYVTKYSTIFRRMNASCPTITTYNTQWWIQNFYWPTFSIICFFISFYSVVYHDVQNGEYANAIKNGTMSTVGLTIAFKHVLLLIHRKSIKNIIKIIDDDYKTAKDFNEDDKQIILKYSRMGTNICNLWLISGVLNGSMFSIKALAIMGYHLCKGNFKLVPVVVLTYPFVDEYKNIPIVFWALFLVCTSFALYAGTIYIGFDPLVPVIMTHTCGQLELMSKNMLKLFSPERSFQDINEELKQINIKLMEIYGIVETVQSHFVMLYEFIMKTNTFLISFSAFEIVEGIKHREVSVEFLSFFFGSILHFYFPCYYSDLLMDKSELLRQAIYSSGWELRPNRRIRKTIIIMLTRTTKSLVIRTVFMPICLNTFSEMARQAYGIYNLMNAAWS